MSTLRQLVSRNRKSSKIIRSMVPALRKCPQKRGVVQKIFIQTPKKPNSAKRKVAKVKLSTGRVISCYIPGVGHKLTKHSVVLVRGGRVQDLIGVRYKPIFGKFDFSPPLNRVSRFSKYGLSRKQFNISEETLIYTRDNKRRTKSAIHHMRTTLDNTFSDDTIIDIDYEEDITDSDSSSEIDLDIGLTEIDLSFDSDIVMPT